MKEISDCSYYIPLLESLSIECVRDQVSVYIHLRIWH